MTCKDKWHLVRVIFKFALLKHGFQHWYPWWYCYLLFQNLRDQLNWTGGIKIFVKKIKKIKRKEKNGNNKQSLFNKWEIKTHTKNLRINATYIFLYQYLGAQSSHQCEVLGKDWTMLGLLYARLLIMEVKFSLKC